jgi:catalase
MVKVDGGLHPGARFNHAKGIVVTGTFTPTAQARSLSQAAHFKGPSVPVTVRFSNGPGVPENPDNSPATGPRGMAIRFTLPDGKFTDIMSISHNGFVVGTG